MDGRLGEWALLPSLVSARSWWQDGKDFEPQAGHRYPPSRRRLIAGCPHSQACAPTASGRTRICFLVGAALMLPAWRASLRSRSRKAQTMRLEPAKRRTGSFRRLAPPNFHDQEGCRPFFRQFLYASSAKLTYRILYRSTPEYLWGSIRNPLARSLRRTVRQCSSSGETRGPWLSTGVLV